MNYRHRYHAGNFADVLKHSLVVALLRGLQRKDKGLLVLDTHAGRGRYDLDAASRGDSLERRPEWPEGIGRLWPAHTAPAAVTDYLALVRAFDAQQRKAEGTPEMQGGPRFYPGSPCLLQALLRPQDRMVLCELHPEEHTALRHELDFEVRARIELLDGYTGIRAALPPPERRALILIDPPYEDPHEYARILTTLQDGFRRLPGGTFAVWYPLTERARIDRFLHELLALKLPPTWTAELTIAGPHSSMKLKGCGLLVVNPPWQLDREVVAWLPWLAETLAQEPGGTGVLNWLVPE